MGRDARSQWGWLLAGMASVGLIFPPQAVSAEPPTAVQPTRTHTAAEAVGATDAQQRQVAPRPVDVALADGAMLYGRVVTPQGTPAAAARVALLQGDEPIAMVVTDEQGRFAIRDVAPGTYRLATESDVVPCRVWAAGTAPPAASATAALVHQPRVVRGQVPVPAFIANNPGWVAAAVFAGVAIAAGTVAIVEATDDDNPPPASP